MKTLYRIVLAGLAMVTLSAQAAQPARGMSMTQVESEFGHPKQKEAPVGKPPISRWLYNDYAVTFQGKTVIRVTSVSHEPTLQVITVPAADAPEAPAEPAPAPLQAEPDSTNQVADTSAAAQVVASEQVAEAASPAEEPVPATPAIETLLNQPATAAGPEAESAPPATANQSAASPPPLPAEEPKPAAPAYRFDPATGRIVIDGL